MSKPTESQIRDSIEYTARRFADNTGGDVGKIREQLKRDVETVEKKTEEKARRNGGKL